MLSSIAFLWWFLLVVCEVSASSMLDIRLRRLTKTSQEAAHWEHVETPVQWEAEKTAVVISDMWDAHHCKTATMRVQELAPHINMLITNLRARGVHIIHCPSGTMQYYAQYPQRLKVQNTSKTGEEIEKVKQAEEKRKMVLLKFQTDDDVDTGCDDPACDSTPCKQKQVWTKEIETIEIHEEDAIADGFDIHYYMQKQGIKHVILLGVHQNKCILRRPFGILALTNLGYDVVLVRDLTDTMYNVHHKPFVNHFIANDLVTWYIEKEFCPTITSNQFIEGLPFVFSGDTFPARDYKAYIHLLEDS